MQEPTLALDLSRFAWKRELGDLTIYGTWLYNADIEDTEPALVLTPRFRPRGFKPCAIALSAAYLYDDPRYLCHAARQFAHDMGFEDSMAVTHRVATVIHDHLRDLIDIPVDPQQAIVIGEASLDAGNGRRHTVELLDHVQERI